jgi:hypothetical protein
MTTLRQMNVAPGRFGGAARYTAVRLLGLCSDLVLALWAIAVLALCVVILAGAML